VTQKITITVSKDPAQGTKIAVEGHAGPSCKTLTAAIENALGKTTSTTTTEEFEQVQQVEQHKQRA
jgi:hypothetical protein